MTEQTVYCEECVEDIPADEVYWEDERLYCRRCGSELEPPEHDIFEEIAGNRSRLIFRDDEEPELEKAEPEEELPEAGEENEET